MTKSWIKLHFPSLRFVKSEEKGNSKKENPSALLHQKRLNGNELQLTKRKYPQYEILWSKYRRNNGGKKLKLNHFELIKILERRCVFILPQLFFYFTVAREMRLLRRVH